MSTRVWGHYVRVLGVPGLCLGLSVESGKGRSKVCPRSGCSSKSSSDTRCVELQWQKMKCVLGVPALGLGVEQAIFPVVQYYTSQLFFMFYLTFMENLF